MSEVSRHDNKPAHHTAVPPDQRLIQIDKTTIKNFHAKTGHVTSTQAEIIHNGGVNHSRKQRQPDSQVQPTARIILSPFAARRLAFFFKRGTVNLPEE